MTNTTVFPQVATTFKGLEKVLSDELNALGAKNVQIANRAVEYEGDQELLYRANYYLRTALKILKPIHFDRIRNEKQLYKSIYKIKWSDYLRLDQSFAIESVVHSPHFSHSKYAALKAKDALVDQFRDRYGKRPDVDRDKPDLRVHIHISNERLNVSLDSSGDPLFKRGYRKRTGSAPLNEVLAAGMIMLSGWDGKSVFIDPMCGSGTIPIEAALIAHGIPAGKFRKFFGFQKWADYKPGIFNSIKSEYPVEINSKSLVYAADIDEKAVQIARENIRNAGLGRMIKTQVGSFEDLEISWKDPGIIMMNPPYGERLVPEDLRKLYGEIGTVLKHKYQGFTAWILTSNLKGTKAIGLRPGSKMELYNGPLECRFMKFDLFKGKLKQQ